MTAPCSASDGTKTAFAARVLLVVASLAAGACKDEPATNSAGERGRVHFAYTTGRCGAASCPMDMPLMVDSEEGTLVVEDGLPELFLRSTNPNVVAVRCKTSRDATTTPRTEACPMGPLDRGLSYDFTIKALAAGEAFIELWTSQSSDDPSALYDRIRVEARDATRIQVELGDDGEAYPVAKGSTFDVKVGEAFVVSRRAYAGEIELQTSGAVGLCSSSPDVVTLFTGGLIFPEQPDRCSTLSFVGGRALSAGSTSITASLGILSSSATVRVSR